MNVSGREIMFWDCYPDAEGLSHTTIDEAVEAYLDDTPREDWPEAVLAEGYARMRVPAPEQADADDLVSAFFERNWEEYQGEDGVEITPRMLEAAATFLKTMHEEFTPWCCEVVHTEEVNVAAWVTEHRPDWLQGRPIPETNAHQG